MSDRDQPAENLDDELLDDEFPPEEPQAVDDHGITGLEELGGESVAEREDRVEPEVWERLPGDDRHGRSTVIEEATDPGRAEGVPVPVEEQTGTGPLAPDDDLTGDETTRDVAPERDPEPAEDAAMHPTDDRRPHG